MNETVSCLVTASAFVLTWAICWYVYGGLGLFLGWLPALVVATLWPVFVGLGVLAALMTLILLLIVLYVDVLWSG